MKGLAYPIQLNSLGGVDFSEDITELIKTNLATILSWSKGERFFLPEFGTGLNKLLDTEPNDDVLQGMIRTLVLTPINEFEPRVKILGYNSVRTQTKVTVTIDYLITESNRPDSFSYPFYKTPSR